MVLDRKAAAEYTSKFGGCIELLNDILDYGTHLVPRVYADSPKDEKAVCLIHVFLRQFLVHLDGVAVLLTSGNTNTARLQLRSLWEISLVVEWILARDAELKIRHFLVANFRKEKHAHEELLSGAFKPSLLTFLSAHIPDQLRFLTEYLTQPSLQEIDSKFQKDYAKYGYDRNWYSVYTGAKTSLHKIAEDLGKEREKEYRVYDFYSQEAHGSDIWRSIKVRFSDEATMIPIRLPRMAVEVFGFAGSIATRFFEMILKEYRPNEAADNFQRKKREWGRLMWKYKDALERDNGGPLAPF